jgi:hypothetical protein
MLDPSDLLVATILDRFQDKAESFASVARHIDCFDNLSRFVSQIKSLNTPAARHAASMVSAIKRDMRVSEPELSAVFYPIIFLFNFDRLLRLIAASCASWLPSPNLLNTCKPSSRMSS